MCGAIAVILIVGYYYITSTKDIYGYENTEELVQDSEIEETKEIKEVEENKIIIHITGAVNKEGIVEVRENARINDVIEAAGGLTENANIRLVNLAYVVEDGQKIYIPSKGEENIEDDGEIITDLAGEKVLEEEETKTGKVNINTANEAELQTLSGIGASTASKIVTYRKENRKI